MNGNSLASAAIRRPTFFKCGCRC